MIANNTIVTVKSNKEIAIVKDASDNNRDANTSYLVEYCDGDGSDWLFESDLQCEEKPDKCTDERMCIGCFTGTGCTN